MSPNVQTTRIQGNGTMNARTQNRNGRLAVLAAGAALLAACSGSGTDPARPTDPAATPAAAAGAGGSSSALVPHLAKAIDPTCAGGVHEKHITMFDCTTCHPVGGSFAFEAPYIKTFPGGTTTQGGSINHVAGTPTTCTVECHFPRTDPQTLQTPPRTVAWNAAAPLLCTDCHATSALPSNHPAVAANATRADCQACHASTGHMGGTVTLVNHPASWMDTASAGFHAFAANRGLGECQKCHAADLSGGATGFSCGQCHDASLPAGVASWRTNCTMCHGRGGTTGAPPAALWGYAGDSARGGGTADPIRVGAHAKHLGPSAISPPMACGTCHVVPADALSAGHVDATAGAPLATVAFSGTAVVGTASATWVRASATCANVYCHGSTLAAGGTNTAPVWTGGAAQATCGTCHGLPPPSPHPAASGLASCATCHPQTMDGAGTVIPPGAGGKHLDGVMQVVGGGGCTSCHGDASRSDPMAAAAPPADTRGNTATTAPGVGAHQAHVAKTTLRATPVGCSECHTVPGSADHASAPLDLTWGPLARTGGIAPTYAGGTCTNYCHVNGAPAWTGSFAATGTTLGCASCHGNPPATGGHARHTVAGIGINMGCNCHPNATAANGYFDRATHVNGVAEMRTDPSIAWNSTTRTCTNFCHDVGSLVWVR